MSFDNENLIALALMSNICHSKSKNRKKKKEKKIKGTKIILMNPWLKNGNDKSSYVNIFSELLLTEKAEFRRYLRMNTTSYY